MRLLLKKIVCLICMVFVLSSCVRNKKEKLKDEWQGKKIVFPTSSMFTKYGIDTINFVERNVDYTMFMYVDSSGCTSCKMKFNELKGLMNEMQDLSNNNIAFKFYFFPKNVSELKYLLKGYKFDIPVCLDMKDEINKLNKFPEDLDFHTFLLDKKNKVLVIGNPLYDVRVMALFKKTILK